MLPDPPSATSERTLRLPATYTNAAVSDRIDSRPRRCPWVRDARSKGSRRSHRRRPQSADAILSVGYLCILFRQVGATDLAAWPSRWSTSSSPSDARVPRPAGGNAMTIDASATNRAPVVDTAARAQEIRHRLSGQARRHRLETARLEYGPLYTLAE